MVLCRKTPVDTCGGHISVLMRPDLSKDAELLILRHEKTVLREPAKPDLNAGTRRQPRRTDQAPLWGRLSAQLMGRSVRGRRTSVDSSCPTR